MLNSVCALVLLLCSADNRLIFGFSYMSELGFDVSFLIFLAIHFLLEALVHRKGLLLNIPQYPKFAYHYLHKSIIKKQLC